jgi:hypothetical protein
LILADQLIRIVDPLWRAGSARIPARRRFAVWLGAQNAVDPGFASPDVNPNISLVDSLLRPSAGAVNGVEIVDLNSKLRSASAACLYRSADNLLYDDSSHLSTYGSIYALRGWRRAQRRRREKAVSRIHQPAWFI